MHYCRCKYTMKNQPLLYSRWNIFLSTHEHVWWDYRVERNRIYLSLYEYGLHRKIYENTGCICTLYNARVWCSRKGKINGLENDLRWKKKTYTMHYGFSSNILVLNSTKDYRLSNQNQYHFLFVQTTRMDILPRENSKLPTLFYLVRPSVKKFLFRLCVDNAPRGTTGT